MGRLPSTYAGLPIMFRVPFAMVTTKVISSAQTGISFPERGVTHAIDKPFEIHRMIPRQTALDAGGIVLAAQPDDDIMAALVSISIRDFGKNNSLTKQIMPLANFTKGSAERTWEWAEPYYMKQGDGFEIGGKADTFPASLDGDSLRTQIVFEGFLCVLAPPMNNR